MMIVKRLQRITEIFVFYCDFSKIFVREFRVLGWHGTYGKT